MRYRIQITKEVESEEVMYERVAVSDVDKGHQHVKTGLMTRRWDDVLDARIEEDVFDLPAVLRSALGLTRNA